MEKKLTFVAALKQELWPLIEKQPAAVRKSVLGNAALYQTGPIDFIRVGMGGHNAEMELTRYLEQRTPSMIINIGAAGSLNQEVAIGSVFNIHSVKFTDSAEVIPVKMLQKMNRFPSACLLTSQIPVQDRSTREALNAEFRCSLIDMEAFQLARTALHYQIPFYCIKIVSDYADERTSETFKKHYQKVCYTLADAVQKYVLS